MIAQKTTHKQRLSKTTIMTFRNLARKGSDQDLENFLFEVQMAYMSEIRGEDYIDDRDYLYVKGQVFECECPYCHEKMELKLDELCDIGGKDEGGYKDNN